MALGVDYFNGVSMAGMGSNIGYDRYGRAQLGFRATYTVVPPLSFYAVVTDVDRGEGGHRHELRLLPGAVASRGQDDREPEQLGVGRFQLHRHRGESRMTWRFLRTPPSIS